MFTIEKEFTAYSPNREGKLTVSKKNKKGSWFWDHIDFKKFILGDIVINGYLVNFGNKWNVVTPLQVKKNEQEIVLNLNDSNIEELCELAVNDFSAFKREFRKFANVEENSEDQDLEVEFTTSFTIEAVEGPTEVRIREIGKKNGKDVNIHYNILELYEIPISEWFLYGRLVQKSGEQTWNVEIAYLFNRILIPIGTIEEEIPLSENNFELFKKEFIPLFEAMKNEKFELVEKTLERVAYLPSPKISKRVKSYLVYCTRNWDFRVFVDGKDYWSFGIEHLVREGSDKKIASILRRLIKLTMKTNDDTKLRRFCNKVITCKN